MDSYFKAAVCDLDKLLDDFELSTEETDCKSALFTTPVQSDARCHAHPESSPTLQTGPDANALHCCPATPSISPNQSEQDTKGGPLTGVDLLSSVDAKTSETLAPPCPDRALKPVCDLVNDTGSVNLHANSHDECKEFDDPTKHVEEDLLVDFDSPAVSSSENVLPASHSLLQGLGSQNHLSGAGSLSLLDVILPAVEKASEPQDSFSCHSKPLEETEVLQSDKCVDGWINCKDQATSQYSMENVSTGSPNSNDEEDKNDRIRNVFSATSSLPDLKDVQHSNDSSIDELEDSVGSVHTEETSALSCLPVAVSMCGSLVASSDCKEVAFNCTKDQTNSLPSDSQETKCNQVAQSSVPTEEAGTPISISDSSPEDDAELLQLLPNPQVESVVLPHSSDKMFEASLSPTDKITSSSLPESGQTSLFDVTPSFPSDYGFVSDYLPTSEQTRMMVTDEELDAYVMGEVEAPRFEKSEENSVDDGFSELHGDLDGNAMLNVGLCGSPSSMEHNKSPRIADERESMKAPSSSQDTDIPTTANDQAICNDSQQPYFGGARPKQLSNQPKKPSSPIEGLNGSKTEDDPADSLENNTQSTSLAVDQAANQFDHGPSCPPQDQNEDSYGHDELSEPPPYPGEKPGEEALLPDQSGVEDEDILGSRQPSWVPDSEAPNCMNCGQRFTFTKRRHHCRACGKVYCAVCCSRKCRLKYLEKEARVCVVCYEAIQKAQAFERMMSPTGSSPNPNIPSEYCSTIPPLLQARAAGTLNSPPPTVMVPVSVLKQPSHDGYPREPKHVWFADGILPNGEVADTTKLSMRGRRSSQESSPVSPEPPMQHQEDKLPTESEGLVPGMPALPAPEGGAEARRPAPSGPWDYALLCGLGSCVQGGLSLVPEDDEGLPPLLIVTGEEDGGDLLVEERPATCQILLLLEEGGPRPLTFVLNANLVVNVKMVTYGGRKCWCLSSNGLQGVGQRELLFVLESLPEENSLPRDLFSLYVNIYQDAQRGKFIEDLGNVTFTDSFLGSKDHGGFLFFSPTCQPLEGLALPQGPFLCGVLIQKLEVPWAKVFPLRLLLCLGAECNMYPSTLVSVRFRESLYKETGHTIMNLLADLRNYQYSLPVVEGLRIHMELGNSSIYIPKAKFNEMQKVVNSSNEHVISIGACFSTEADSHLVCRQNEDGNYQTKTNIMPGKTRRVTGASYVVFNGALKASSGFIAKSSIVEDGLMVQIPPDTMEALRQALRDQADFQIPCGKVDSSEPRENVVVRWVDWTPPNNSSVTSPIDGKSLEGVSSVRIQQDSEFEMDGRTIRCTEVFYLLKSADCSLPGILASCSQFQREIATAGCAALCPHLCILTGSGINTLGLRVTTDTDMVEYQAGSGGRVFPQKYMNELDGALIPVIHGGSSSVPQQAMDMEFIFYISHSL